MLNYIMCTKGLMDIYFYLYDCCVTLQSLTYKLFGSFHTIYFYDGEALTNITINYHTNISMSSYQQGMYYVQTSGESCDDNFIFNGTIDDVTRYIISHNDSTIPIISYQNMYNRKNIILSDNEQILNINLHPIDRYYCYLEHDKTYAKVTDFGTILKILLDTSCTHVSFIQTFPFKKNTYEIKDVTLKMLYS